MKRHITLTTILTAALVAAYILWVTLESECPTDEFITVVLSIPVGILLIAHVLAVRWPVLDVKPTICIVLGYVCAFVAYQAIMASYGYSRHPLTVAFEAAIWVMIATLMLSLRMYGAVKLIEDDMA